MPKLDCPGTIPYSNMMDQFLSLSEAEKYTGKSRNSLRRFVEGITKPDSHPDRHFIQPTPEEVSVLHKNNSPFSWKVNVVLLDREFRQPQGSSAAQQSAGETRSAAIELLQQTIGMLKTELDEKNRQIAQFQERDRETNILLQQTTEKLVMLTEGKSRAATTSDAVTVESNQGQASEVRSKHKRAKKKRTLWQKLNRPLFTGK